MADLGVNPSILDDEQTEKTLLQQDQQDRARYLLAKTLYGIGKGVRSEYGDISSSMLTSIVRRMRTYHPTGEATALLTSTLIEIASVNAGSTLLPKLS